MTLSRREEHALSRVIAVDGYDARRGGYGFVRRLLVPERQYREKVRYAEVFCFDSGNVDKPGIGADIWTGGVRFDEANLPLGSHASVVQLTYREYDMGSIATPTIAVRMIRRLRIDMNEVRAAERPTGPSIGVFSHEAQLMEARLIAPTLTCYGSRQMWMDVGERLVERTAVTLAETRQSAASAVFHSLPDMVRSNSTLTIEIDDTRQVNIHHGFDMLRLPRTSSLGIKEYLDTYYRKSS